MRIAYLHAIRDSGLLKKSASSDINYTWIVNNIPPNSTEAKSDRQSKALARGVIRCRPFIKSYPKRPPYPQTCR